MAVQASAESIRAMKKDIQQTIADIQRISNGIKAGIGASNWNDSQAEEFNQLMREIAHLTSSPTGTLQDALPQLERLAQSLDAYQKIKF